MDEIQNNPLGTAPVGKMMMKFAIPSIIAMLVGSIYNIVDQLFIGNCVGALGNAATNVAFPINIMCIAVALLFGIGGASAFNLRMGKGDVDDAPYIIGNAVTAVTLFGVFISAITLLFTKSILGFCGAPEEVMPYALPYVTITAIGFPFLIITAAGGHLIRADGKPHITMTSSILGAVINVVLDALFVPVLGYGMQGAAWATVIGQVISGVYSLYHLTHLQTVPISSEHFILKFCHVKESASLGIASCFNQLSMLVVQIVLNNSLTYYGGLSHYGSAIPLAVAGVVIKTSQVMFSIIIGIAQGSQPLESFNYGAKNFARVKESLRLALLLGGMVSVFSFTMFQVFPRQILRMFGDGTPEYYEFGVRYFRIFLFFICINFIQPIVATFFTSIGKPVKGIFLSLSRQIILFLPLLIIFPRIMGIDGILWTGFTADGTAAVIATLMGIYEAKKL